MRTGWLTHPAMLDHNTGPGHPERAERIRAIIEAVHQAGLMNPLVPIEVPPARDEDILAVHTREYLQRLEAACRRGDRYIDVPDSAICVDSYRAAQLAVGAALSACDAVLAGQVDNAFCAIRPPGHHCEADRSMGFCLLNNVAIAARYLQRRHGLQRVLILDWDVHHGNGTQHIFERDPTVFYCSLHEHPAYRYPGTGYAWERGEGPGAGTTLNLPMPPNSGDADYQQALEARFLPEARRFAPDFILLLAGFDSHRDDPLATQAVTQAGFDWMGWQLKQLAQQVCAGRLVSLLEGGYNLDVLRTCVVSHLRILMQDP